MNIAKKVIQRSRLNPGGDSAYAGRHTTPLSALRCECPVGAYSGESMSVTALSQQVLQQWSPVFFFKVKPNESLPHKSETTASLVWLNECSYHFIAARCRCAGRCRACDTPDGKSVLLWPGGKAIAC